MNTRTPYIKWISLVLALLYVALLSWSFVHREKNSFTPFAPEITISLPNPSIPENGQAARPRPDTSDPSVLFVVEAYDKTQEIYWKKHNDEEMNTLFLSAYQKAIATSTNIITLSQDDRSGFIAFLLSDLASREEDAKQSIAIETVSLALSSLEPTGRNQLMSEHEEIALRERVSNIDLTKDLYANIGAPKGSSPEVVAQKYEEQKAVLEASTSPSAKEALAEATYAKDVLTDTTTKARYDTGLIEPTVFSHVIGNDLLYIGIEKIAPTTMEEFYDALIRASSTPDLDHLVIDLRGNVGGALDFPLSFLGAYVGVGQLAVAFEHQGAVWSEQTIFPHLPLLDRFTKQVVIVDKATQSTAEVVAAMFKQKKLALVIGEPTAGWGTVENTFPMETVIDPKTKYTLFLVHSLTLADDGQAIQGRGVIPDIDVTKPGWQEDVAGYFKEAELVPVLFDIMSLPPTR